MKKALILLALLTACAPKAEPKVLEPYSGPKIAAPNRRANMVKDFGPASLVRKKGKAPLGEGCRRYSTTDPDGTVDTWVSCTYD